MYEKYKKPISSEKYNPEERIEHASGVPHTDQWDLPFYEETLGISMYELMGQKVLDIGGAPDGAFAREAIDMGIDVVTLNAKKNSGAKQINNFGFESGFAGPDVPTKTVQGLAQQLPFQDNSFDCVISAGSIPLYLPRNEAEFRETFKEILRTLKPGGKGIFYPITEDLHSDPAFKKITAALKTECLIEFESVHFEGDPGRRYRMRLTKPEFLF